jgi:oligopeptide/dipeptide ABC transporter ATP-binding protein
MPKKLAIQPSQLSKDATVKAIAAQLAGKKAQAKEQAVDLLRQVHMPLPERRCAEYPHQLSGGMRQRVMIAMALACRPSILIADEPTTALDVTIQAQILELLKRLQGELGMAVLLITHDLGVVAEQAHRVVVMYAGRLVERAKTAKLFTAAAHPYSAALLRCIPDEDAGDRLAVIEGTVPTLTALPPGCRFEPRCPKLCGCPHTMSLGDPMQWRGGPQTCDDNCAAVRLCRRTRVPSAAAARDNLPVADADFNWGRRR